MVARNDVETTPSPLDGAWIGVGIGLLAALLGIVTTQWWLLAALPAGGAGGALATRWIRAGRRIPVRAVVYPALVADLVGAASICGFFAIGSSVPGTERSPVDIAIAIVSDTAIALAFGGVFGLVLTVPAAWLGAVLLRRLARESLSAVRS